MAVTTVLAVVSVSDPEEARSWYERLFGRPADTNPMGSLLEWKITDDGWLQVFEDGERAGNSYLTLAVDDLDAQIADLAEVGLSLEEIEATPPMRLAQIRDPDDNLITFGQQLKGHEGVSVKCSCCGEERPTAALPTRDDVHLCRECALWMAGKLGVESTPTLPVRDMVEATSFYERAGFGVRVYREDEDDPGGFAFVDFDGQSVFDLGVEELDPAANRAGCYLVVADADGWHRRMAADGLPVTAIADQPWGMREFTLTDPFGNRVRIGRASD